MVIRQVVSIVLVLFSFTLAAQDNAYQSITLKTFPDLKPVTLASLDNGKPTYLKMWATWCKPCMEQMPHFEQLAQQYSDKINIIAVNININEENSEIIKVVERFKLTMPLWLDNEGELGVALGLVGTPYSVLIDPNGQVVYTTHESDEKLDKLIALLAKGQSIEFKPTATVNAQQTAEYLAPWQQGDHLLFFTATWCDWYLADSRPAMAEQCKSVQTNLNSLFDRLPNLPWHGVVNHLWTDEQALKDFEQLYQMKIQFSIDSFGVLFNYFTIRNIPTLLWIKDGKVLKRFDNFTDQQAIVNELQK